jgi:hypothetical protein
MSPINYYNLNSRNTNCNQKRNLLEIYIKLNGYFYSKSKLLSVNSSKALSLIYT